MSGFMKTVLISTQPPGNFSKKIHRLFNSINHRQSVNTQPTHQAFLCLAGCLLAAKAAGHDCQSLSCKEIRISIVRISKYSSSEPNGDYSKHPFSVFISGIYFRTPNASNPLDPSVSFKAFLQ